MFDYVWLIPTFPLIGFLINGLYGKKLPKNVVGTIGATAVGLSFLLTVAIFLEFLKLPPDAPKAVQKVMFTWISAGNFSAEVAFLIDPLSLIMLLVVSGVSTLIHIYSIGYMHDDPGFPRYFAYLNLFVFNMLILVSANNFLLMFVGWEGVGLCSYLLIGFWYEKKSASDAGKKAFVVNRIGDFGFLLGMFIIFWTFGTLNFKDVFAAAAHYPVGAGIITAATLCLFLGATGKSAQIPLYTWLPDAMEGPTPVSALIHAATMVTAGVYMVARCSALFVLAPVSLTVVAVIGPADRLLCRHHGYGAIRHQTGPGLLHGQPVGLYVPGLRRGRLYLRYLPSDDPRLLQGPPLLGVRLGDSRHARRAGHAQHGRPQEAHAHNLLDLYAGYPGHCRHLPLRRLLQ